MGGHKLGDAPPTAALPYATPAHGQTRFRSMPALFGGMFLVLVAAFTLVVGFIVIASYRGYTSSDFSVALAFGVCIFSATCLAAGLPLIYRGSRADD